MKAKTFRQIASSACNNCVIFRCMNRRDYRVIRTCMKCGHVVGIFFSNVDRAVYKTSHLNRVGLCPLGKPTHVEPAAVCPKCFEFSSEPMTLPAYAKEDAERCNQLSVLSRPTRS